MESPKPGLEQPWKKWYLPVKSFDRLVILPIMLAGNGGTGRAIPAGLTKPDGREEENSKPPK
jgi:hypothetical protein